MAVEEINAFPAVLALMRWYSRGIPIVQTVDEIVNNAADPKEMVCELIGRKNEAELSNANRKRECTTKEIFMGRVLL